MWPLSLPASNLNIDLSNNPIRELVNELNLSYDSENFVDMLGDRYVNVENNSLTSLDDTSLLQYGMGSARDFEHFLRRIAQFDLRQPVNRFVCHCPNATGLYVVQWFRQSRLYDYEYTEPIYNLNCSSIESINERNDSVPVNVFNFSCKVIKIYLKINYAHQVDDLFPFNKERDWQSIL